MRGNFVSADHDACGVGFVAQLGSAGSRAVIDRALEALRRLGHRGGVDADGRSGDGAGLLTAIPDKLFRNWARKRGIGLAKIFGVGMVFMPADAADCDRHLIERTARNCGLRLLGWRQVPSDPSILGPQALRTLPLIEQCVFASAQEKPSLETSSIEARLFALRKRVESEVRNRTYFCSLSSKTIVYKGLLTPEQLSAFYLDLAEPDFVSQFAIFHQRYSTNTRPSWSLAQPFRLVAHNGEINTITANRRWQRAKQEQFRGGLGLSSNVQLLEQDVSDSASFDNAYEIYLRRGFSPVAAMSSMVPPAWENDHTIPVAVRSFLQDQAQEQEPWDGPAALIFTDGESVGAKLDRNGLRPLRYTLTSDGLVVLGSEAGIADLQNDRITKRRRLGPGEVLIVEPKRGTFLAPKRVFSRSHWIPASPGAAMTRVAPCETPGSNEAAEPTSVMAAFGWSEDKLRLLFQPLLQTGQEAVWSMGDDTAPAFLSNLSRTLWDHCKQRFAQVTNPPIDPLRETHVMSLDVYLGKGLVLPSPIIDAGQRKILEEKLSPIERLDFTFPAAKGVEGAKAALSGLQRKARSMGGKEIGCVVLSDHGVNTNRAALPALLALAAVWKAMVEADAWNVLLMIETGQVIETHHIGLLVAAGASAVLPYVAFQQAAALKPDGVQIYRQAMEKGLLKVMARMGISNISSYRNSQLFEIVGLDSDLCETFFEDAGRTPGGKGLDELLQDCLNRHQAAFASGNGALRDEGLYRFRHNGERHATSPEVVRRMHRYIKSPNHANFKLLTEFKRDPVAIRDLLEIKRGNPKPLSEVESEASVLSRFSTQAMSLGAISPETHRTLAIAMNRLGARSNTGEGGEDPEVYAASSEANNRVKQVASARFGVTPEYLVNADELEIKIAQGAKPGEGGQLPATKVTPYIARLRHSAPGMALISPPPHHDIYSIEDLAQLIYDLRAVNPLARIGVKLVSSSGIGIIAAGVAKAGAGVITISGHDGGTGASPLSSITNTGLPWEVGLRDAHVSLLRAGLRRRVRLRVDGGLKFGRDVIIAALLGADEFGFGTAALLALGCVMARQCHLNTCPVGIATQDEKFRARFAGKPEMVESYFRALAAEVRELLAQMGAHSIDEIVGAAERLSPRDAQAERSVASLIQPVGSPTQIDCPPEPDSNLQLELIRTVDELGTPATQSYQFPISGADRAIGAHLSGEILRRRRSSNIVASASYEFTGTAGQSFGAFLIPGISFRLNGEANDYVAKGMSGGSISITAGEKASLRGDVLAGNTVLYGATAGELYIAGRAGERFGVRNSGALAVVEGVGQHACEYMTAGVVVILGPTGNNLGAGMTGGLAYVLREFAAEHMYNRQSVRTVSIDLREEMCLRRVLSHHLSWTASPVAAGILQAGQPLPLVRIEPVSLPCSISETWDAVLKRPALGIEPLDIAGGSREWPTVLPEATSTLVE